MRKNSGFTLVEMSIVLVVIGLVLAGILSTFRAQMESAKLRETRQTMAEIKESLIAYTLARGHLPCPANPTLANTAAGAGLEDRVVATGLCNRLNGVIPWATLGVKEVDSWGGRFSYSVSDDPADMTRRFARRLAAPTDMCSTGTIPANTTTFGLCAAGTISVCSVSTPGCGGPATPIVAWNVAAVIISHGKNRRGSFNPGGGARIAVAAAALDEAQNANGNTNVGGALDTNFVSRTFVYNDNQLAPAYYDDLTEWIAVPTLVGRMVSAGRLP